MTVLSLPRSTTTGRIEIASLAVWLAGGALIGVAVMRFLQEPSFWLDEAFVALSLRDPSPATIFARLQYGQLFPRVYLAAIALLREAFGYRIWSLRLLPTVSFVVATLFWMRLLVLRSRTSVATSVLAGVLFLGSSFWLDQAIQLKQYSFDVLLALVPFLLDDAFFKDTLFDGKRKLRLAIIALPCLLSYTYPLALGARVLGWYLHEARGSGLRLRASAVSVLSGSVMLALAGVWMTDHRFNLLDGPAYLAYWSDCILRSCLQHNASSAPRLLAKFLWGWHGRQPLMTAGVVPLQILGVYSVIKRLKTGNAGANQHRWGSRSVGSLVFLSGTILASALFNYPICAGRAALFTQVHTQILTLEGALFIHSSRNRIRITSVILYIFIGVVLLHSGRDYLRLAKSGPAENLRPLLPEISTEIASTIWVHPCSTAQVRSLPEPLPGHIVFGTDEPHPPPGKTWVLWTHLGDESCANSLEQVRLKARSWQLVSEGPGRGLALAEF
jgi:hypothetical protein